MARALLCAIAAFVSLMCVMAQPEAVNPLFQAVLSLGGGGGGGASLMALLQQAGLPRLGEAGQVGNVRGMFCSDPKVTPGGKVPSMLYGPQLNITLSAGNCSLAAAGPFDGKNVTCFGPHITYSQAPIRFIPKHLAPDEFVDGSCVYGKAVGPQKAAEETVQYSAGDDLVFADLEQFLEALAAGALTNL